MNNRLLATPLADIMGEHLFSMIDLDTDQVTIHNSTSGDALDTFTFQEYGLIIWEGKRVGDRLQVNW